MIVGLTGGIGSGKSEVSRRFEALGIQVVDADVVAREVVEPGSPALQKIAEHFGSELLHSNGSLNRAALRERIFTHPVEKQWLENLLHPIIRQHTIQQLECINSPYGILTSPLLLETSQRELVDRILVVDANEQQQISRASLRDQNSAEQIAKIMASQISRQERLAQADDIIHNNGDLQALDQQVYQLHLKYLTLAAQQ